MRDLYDLLTNHYGAQIRAWAEPSDDGERYEASINGRVVLAESPHLLLRAVIAAQVPSAVPRLRLAA